VRIQKLDSADAFVVWDLDGAPRSVGIARLAPKILQDGAEMLARSVTYSFATFGLQLSGASAGINAKPEVRDTAIKAFLDDVASLTDGGRLVLHAGNGLTDLDLAPITKEAFAPLADDELAAHGAIAAAGAFAGGLDGRSAVIVGAGPVADAAALTLADRGVDVREGGLETDVDLAFVAGKSGVVDHRAVAGVTARTVVPLTPLPVTAKAFAAFRRAGVSYVPDFVALAAPLLAACDADGGDPVERVATVASELAAHGPDAWIEAVARAETFLATWQDTLPFGRPLAA